MIQFNMRMWRIVTLCLWGSTIMGCAGVTPNGLTGHPTQQELIGKTKQELLVCAGTPASEKTNGEQTVIIYYREASPLEESFAGSRSSFAKVHHGCQATVSLRHDHISQVRYDSVPSSYQDEDHCVEIFERCTGP